MQVTYNSMGCTIVAIFTGGGFLPGWRRGTVTPPLRVLRRRRVLPDGPGGRLSVTHHHLLVLLMLLLLYHQQLVVVLLLLLTGTHGVVRLGTVVGGVDQTVVRTGEVQGLLVAPGGVVHPQAVLLLVHLHVHLLLLLLLVVLDALLLVGVLTVLLLGVYGRDVELFVAEAGGVKRLQRGIKLNVTSP